MILTEAEAVKKWCPFVRAAEVPYLARETGTNIVAVNRPAPDGCIATRCMAWRWHDSPADVARYNAEPDTAHAAKTYVAKGYCGLAGTARP